MLCLFVIHSFVIVFILFGAMEDDHISKKVKLRLDDEVSNEIDKLLLKVMRPHQIEATKFLLNRLKDNNNNNTPNSYEFPLTGAVLADEMGTGKVLFHV